jgi:hypothetical protein
MSCVTLKTPTLVDITLLCSLTYTLVGNTTDQHQKATITSRYHAPRRSSRSDNRDLPSPNSAAKEQRHDVSHNHHLICILASRSSRLISNTTISLLELSPCRSLCISLPRSGIRCGLVLVSNFLTTAPLFTYNGPSYSRIAYTLLGRTTSVHRGLTDHFRWSHCLAIPIDWRRLFERNLKSCCATIPTSSVNCQCRKPIAF